MKKQILNFGKAINRAEQKLINGGLGNSCHVHIECKKWHNDPYALCINGNCIIS